MRGGARVLIVLFEGRRNETLRKLVEVVLSGSCPNFD